MKVLLDTNVVLDVILKRPQWLAESEAVWQAHLRQTVEAYLVATSVTNIFYIVRRSLGLAQARIAARGCLTTFPLLPVASVDLMDADALPGSDLEDNLVIACARRAALDAIITRDAKGFSASSVPVFSPAELIANLPP